MAATVNLNAALSLERFVVGLQRNAHLIAAGTSQPQLRVAALGPLSAR
jgi:hypothetical protein